MDNEIKEKESKQSRRKEIIFVVLFLISIVLITYYFQVQENRLSQAYFQGYSDSRNYMVLHILNESTYCNQILISYINPNNVTYSVNLISTNCLKGGQNE